jgi:hypothetical protein
LNDVVVRSGVRYGTHFFVPYFQAQLLTIFLLPIINGGTSP